MKKFKKLWNTAVNSLLNRIRGHRMITRLSIAGIVVGAVPLVTVAVVAYVVGSQSILDKVHHATAQTIEQVSMVVGTNLQIIINDGIEIAYSDQVQKALVEYASMNSEEKNRVRLDLAETINRKYIYNSYNGEITLYTLHKERINAYGPTDFRFIPKQIRLNELIDRIHQLSGKPLWLSVDAGYEQRMANRVGLDRNSIVLARAIKSLSTGEIIGYMTIRLDESVISGLYQDLKISEDTEVFILNSEQTVVSAAGSQLRPAAFFEDAALCTRVVAEQAGPFEHTFRDERYLIVSSPIRQADWYTVALIPTDYLYANTRQLLSSILLTSTLCGILAILFFLLIATSIIRPVHALQEAMELFGRDLDSQFVDENGRDEIAMLTRGFNHMTVEITDLVDDIREKERQKHELETRALQAQINPHFLANMLSTVSYMAQLKGEKDIEEMVGAIITLLSESIRNDNNFNTVREELLFLNSYVTTQQHRMMGRFRVQYQIDPDIEECLLPRFILQPIVENALIHGIEPSNRMGLIVIKGYSRAGQLHFAITDNGVGMSPAMIERIMREPDAEGRRRMTSIGIPNVQGRLRLLYGAPYGLVISSVEHVFTTIEIVLPYKKVGETDDQAAARG